MPEEFESVKVYYQKIKGFLAANAGNSGGMGNGAGAGRKIDKEVAARLIQRSL